MACGDSPTEPSWDGQVRVSGFVRDFRTNTGVGGARVVVGNATVTTDATGFYSLTVPAGEQRVSIDEEMIAVANMRDRTYQGDFYVHLAGCVGRYGTVLDSVTRRGVARATVSVGGSGAVTDQNGWFQVSLGCPGSCVGFNTTFLTITHPDYVSGSFVAGRGVCFVERKDYELTRR